MLAPAVFDDLPRPLLWVTDDAPPRGAISWSRYTAAWPPDGPFAAAALRLPLDKGAYEMALHAIAARLPAGAPLLVYGANDEGIKSAPKAFAPFFEDAETAAAKSHARLWRAARTGIVDGLRGSLSDWRRETPLTLDGRAISWVSYPGVFAKGGLDAGTALLLAHLPDAKGLGALDFGAGTGVIARVLADRGARVTMIERDAVALEAARANVPEAEAVLDGALSGGPFDLIVSNPPIHNGKARDLGTLSALIAGADCRLARTGALLLVVQKTVPVPRLAEGCFAQRRLVVEDGGFRVWRLENDTP